jgi:excinuclease ABC subunit C
MVINDEAGKMGTGRYDSSMTPNLQDAHRSNTFDAESFLKTLTSKPGVYRMLSASGDVLYVGKARNLKTRVTSYFRASGLTIKTMALVSKISDVQVTVTNSETEALLLEQSLIKEEKPPYNILLRDDKSYPYIYLTDDTQYPQLTFHRGAKKNKGRYFGPFPSTSSVRESLNILHKLFQIRSCDNGFFKNRSRPCLQYQIKRCSAPCVGRINTEQYADDVRLAAMFLEGESMAVLKEFKVKMQAASNRLDFERAAKYRDQIGHLQQVQENQYVHSSGGEVDVFGIATKSGYACVQGLFVRDGRVLGNRTWFPKNSLDSGPDELLFAFLSQYYFGFIEREIPKSVIASIAHDDRDMLHGALTRRTGRKVVVSSAVRGKRARWLAMVNENAELSLDVYVADRKNVFGRFLDLQEALGMEAVPQRLEAFDVSHTAGTQTVASCVVFDSTGPVNSDYRRFNIKGVTAGDDFGAMEQALRRRYRRVKDGEAILPDALIIDGGLGQVNRAAKVLGELQIEDVCLIGIAKGPSRKPGLEQILVAGQGNLMIGPNSGALHLLQHIRDEAHRFAIAGHRSRRQKRQRKSELDGIPGVGPKRKQQLLAHFGSVASIKGASAEEIVKVPGINRKLAYDIGIALHET